MCLLECAFASLMTTLHLTGPSASGLAQPRCCRCRGSFWEDVELGKWVSAARTAKRWNILSAAEQEALSSLGFTFAMATVSILGSWAGNGWHAQPGRGVCLFTVMRTHQLGSWASTSTA